MRSTLRHPLFGLAALATLALSGSGWAQAPASGGGAVYRCPGPPVLYTDRINAQEAREKGCKLLEDVPITVIQGPRARVAPAASAASGTASRPLPDAKVDGNAQRQRDRESRRILEAELKREEDKLAALQRDYNNGEPERRGEERNYQAYLDRVNQMKAAIARSEADIAAIKRELSKLPP